MIKRCRPSFFTTGALGRITLGLLPFNDGGARPELNWLCRKNDPARQHTHRLRDARYVPDVRSSMWKLRLHGLCQVRNCKCPFRSNAISERRKRRTKPNLCSDGKNEENHMERRLWSKQRLLWFPHLAFHLPFRCRIDM